MSILLIHFILILLFLNIIPSSTQPTCEIWSKTPPHCSAFLDSGLNNGSTFILPYGGNQSSMSMAITSGAIAFSYLPPTVAECQRLLFSLLCQSTLTSCIPGTGPAPPCMSTCLQAKSICPNWIPFPFGNCSQFPTTCMLSSTIINPTRSLTIPCVPPYVQSSPYGCSPSCPYPQFFPFHLNDMLSTIGKVFGVLEIILLLCTLGAGIIESRMDIFSGEDQQFFPIFFTLCVLLFSTVSFASRWSTAMACNNAYTPGDKTNPSCVASAIGILFATVGGSFWYLMMSIKLLDFVYQLRLFASFTTIKVIACHIFCWSLCILLAGLGIGLGGAAPYGSFCVVDYLQANGWYLDGFNIIPLGIFGMLSVFFTIASIARIILVLGATSITKYYRLVVITIVYSVIFLYFLGLRVYARIFLPSYMQNLGGYYACVANGVTTPPNATTSSPPQPCDSGLVLFNFGAFFVFELLLLLLAGSLFFVFVARWLPALRKRASSSLGSSRDSALGQ